MGTKLRVLVSTCSIKNLAYYCPTDISASVDAVFETFQTERERATEREKEGRTGIGSEPELYTGRKMFSLLTKWIRDQPTNAVSP